MKSKLADIEAALTRVGQVAIPLMQQLYTTRKVFRVVQPNNSLSEYVINKKLVDDKSNEIKVVNDITIPVDDDGGISSNEQDKNNTSTEEKYDNVDIVDASEKEERKDIKLSDMIQFYSTHLFHN